MDMPKSESRSTTTPLEAQPVRVAGSEPVSFPNIVARLYPNAEIALRVRLLRSLLRPLGPMAVAAVAAGAFVKCLERAGWNRLSVTVDDALSATSGQIMELARYVEQSDPNVVERIYRMLDAHPSSVALIGSSVLAMAIARRVAGRRHAQPAAGA